MTMRETAVRFEVVAIHGPARPAPFLRRVAAIVLCGLAFAFPSKNAAAGTLVRFTTSQGTFDAELFDVATPATVANFLGYVNDGDYTNSFVHRSTAGFLIQGGGFTFSGGVASPIPPSPPVANEPGLSNTRGTLAMFKPFGNPDGATSQWFINLANNSVPLDAQNGGFTVFGRILGSGMQVVDAISSLPRLNAGAPNFDELPVVNYSSGPLLEQNLVMLSSIAVAGCFELGDMNGDCSVDNEDITPFVLALIDLDFYAASFPGLDALARGDINLDGALDNEDISPFVTLLLGGAAVAVPEPASAVLALPALLIAVLLPGRRLRGPTTGLARSR
jgi:peptidyl-prolyl cis-trans isomerase A (cyclophilin A)